MPKSFFCTSNAWVNGADRRGKTTPLHRQIVIVLSHKHVETEDRYLIPPQPISQRYAVSLSSSQLLALAIIVLVTFTNTRGLQYGKIIQNIFTIAKTGALLALIMLGLFLGRNSAAVHTNFAHTWTTQAVKPIVPGLAATTFFGLLVALCNAMGTPVTTFGEPSYGGELTALKG